MEERAKEHGKWITNRWGFALYIGFYAGLIWGGLKLIEFAMRFTNVVPGFLLEPFFRHRFLVTYWGLALGWISFFALSLAASLIYMFLFFKLSGPWPGIAYGSAWWVFLYLLIGPLTGMVPAITHLDMSTLVTDFFLFLLWGLFIGYSISMEFNDEHKREPEVNPVS